LLAAFMALKGGHAIRQLTRRVSFKIDCDAQDEVGTPVGLRCPPLAGRPNAAAANGIAMACSWADRADHAREYLGGYDSRRGAQRCDCGMLADGQADIAGVDAAYEGRRGGRKKRGRLGSGRLTVRLTRLLLTSASDSFSGHGLS